MYYIEDLNTETTFECRDVKIDENSITVNMDSRKGFLGFSCGDQRNGVFMNNGNDININLPGTITGTKQQLRFTRR